VPAASVKYNQPTRHDHPPVARYSASIASECGLRFRARRRDAVGPRGHRRVIGLGIFAASWDDLELDTYLADRGRYRRRRHAVTPSRRKARSSVSRISRTIRASNTIASSAVWTDGSHR